MKKVVILAFAAMMLSSCTFVSSRTQGYFTDRADMLEKRIEINESIVVDTDKEHNNALTALKGKVSDETIGSIAGTYSVLVQIIEQNNDLSRDTRDQIQEVFGD